MATNRTKRIVCILLMLLMLVSMTACSDDEEAVKETTQVPTVEGITVENGDYAAAIDSTQIGDFFVIGSYEFNRNKGEEPIQWRVIDKNEKGIFLLSEHIWKDMQYIYDGYDATWHTSYIHEYFNDPGWMKNWFSEEEMKHMRYSNLAVSNNPEYETDGGKETVDRLFLLSYDEVLKYFPEEEARCAKFPGYSSADSWWLRTPGKDTGDVMCVTETGSFDIEGQAVYEDVGVRPAMWLMKEEQADIFGVKTQQYPKLTEANTGNMVLFGNYETDGDSSESDPIEWYVLAKDDDKLLLISRYIIDKQVFGNTEHWKDCSLREWLNSDFYDSSFSKEEKSKIQRMITSDKTDDKVFLLSAEEARYFFSSDSTRIAYVSDNLILDEFKNFYGIGEWWTRSVSTALNGKGVVPVEADGNVRSAGTTPYSADGDYIDTGVRPVICVDLSSAEDKALNMSIFGCDSNHDLDNEPKPKGSGDKNCPTCKGKGSVKYYYGSSDLEAILDGYDPYTFGKCPSCG